MIKGLPVPPGVVMEPAGFESLSSSVHDGEPVAAKILLGQLRRLSTDEEDQEPGADARRLAALHASLGGVYGDAGKRADAITHFEKAKSIVKDLGDKVLMG